MANMTLSVLPLAAFCLFHCAAQTTEAPAFEVASVRPASGARFDGARMQTSHGAMTVRGLSLRECLQWAYQMQPAQVTGPDWLDDVKLDIVAKAGAAVDERQLFLMLRTLLGERLAVKAHVERKEMPVYALVIGKRGSKMTESTTEGPWTLTRDQNGIETYMRWSIYELAAEFSSALGRPLINATGLNGRYDFHINPSTMPDLRGMDQASMKIAVIQTQLGLDIESRREPVEVLIVDHAEKKPTEN
jgi:uncharacterized protein (TIGR03435 family)